VVRDNVPVVAAVVVPVVAFVLAGADVMSLETAFRVSIAFSLLALVAVGLDEGRTSGLSWPRSLLSAAAAGGIGLLVVLVEAFFE
jgi:Flp pilus assembly protein protease CpaA